MVWLGATGPSVLMREPAAVPSLFPSAVLSEMASARKYLPSRRWRKQASQRTDRRRTQRNGHLRRLVAECSLHQGAASCQHGQGSEGKDRESIDPKIVCKRGCLPPVDRDKVRTCRLSRDGSWMLTGSVRAPSSIRPVGLTARRVPGSTSTWARPLCQSVLRAVPASYGLCAMPVLSAHRCRARGRRR
jgi:hypothetical protein